MTGSGPGRSAATSDSGRRFFLLYTAPLLAYVVLISWLSHRPARDVPVRAPFDKAVHALEYVPVGVLTLRWWRGRPRTDPSLAAAAGAVAVGLAIGVLDEVHQSFVPGRSAEVLDVLADGTGVLLGVLLYASARRAADRRKCAPYGQDPRDPAR